MHLCCFITKQLMINPVTNSVGNTYDNDSLIKYINENGLKDPKT